MAVIYDSNWRQLYSSPISSCDYFKVEVITPSNEIRTMFMTGTSRRNIFKQLDEMIKYGDDFKNPIVTKIPYAVKNFSIKEYNALFEKPSPSTEFKYCIVFYNDRGIALGNRYCKNEDAIPEIIKQNKTINGTDVKAIKTFINPFTDENRP